MASLLPDDVQHYLTGISPLESAAAKALREYTQAHVDQSQMMSAPDQARLLAFLIRLIQAEHVLELGVYTGYASLVMAEALPKNGRLVACDKSDNWPKHAKIFWQQAGVKEKIDLRIGLAIETLAQLAEDDLTAQFDMVFIDADKLHYPEYFQACLPLVRLGGLIVFDDTLWIGRNVAQCDTPSTRAVHRLNGQLQSDQRVQTAVVSVGTGMTLCQVIAHD